MIIFNTLDEVLNHLVRENPELVSIHEGVIYPGLAPEKGILLKNGCYASKIKLPEGWYLDYIASGGIGVAYLSNKGNPVFQQFYWKVPIFVE